MHGIEKEYFRVNMNYTKRTLDPFLNKVLIENFEVEARRYYQLMRNYIIGEHFASRLNKVFHLVAIASGKIRLAVVYHMKKNSKVFAHTYLIVQDAIF